MRNDTYNQANIAKQNLVWISWDYLGDTHDDLGMTLVLKDERERRARIIAEHGLKPANASAGVCDHCGSQNALYVDFFRNIDTNEIVRLGHICATKVGLGDHDFNPFKRMVKDARESKAGKAKARLVLTDAGHEWAIRFVDTNGNLSLIRQPWDLDDRKYKAYLQESVAQARAANPKRYTHNGKPMPDSAVWSDICDYGSPIEEEVQAKRLGARNAYAATLGMTWADVKWHVERFEDNLRVARDMVDKLVKYGSLSDKQWAYFDKLADFIHRLDLDAFSAEIKIKLAEKIAEREAARRAPAGREVVKGEVLMVRDYDSFYGTTTKMLIKADGGFKVFCSVPAAMVVPSRGDRVQVTATLEPKADDPTFAIGKRPTKGEILEEATAA